MTPLFDLPAELFQNIVDLLVKDGDLPAVFRLRAVCRKYIHFLILIDEAWLTSTGFFAQTFNYELLASTPIRKFVDNERYPDDGSTQVFGPRRFLRQYLGTILFHRVQRPLDVYPGLPSIISKLADELLHFVPVCTNDNGKSHAGTSTLRTTYLRDLSHALVAVNQETWPLIRAGRAPVSNIISSYLASQQITAGDYLAAAAAVDNIPAIHHFLSNGSKF